MGRLAGVWNLAGHPVDPEAVHTMMAAVAPASPDFDSRSYVQTWEELGAGYRPALSVSPPEGGIFSDSEPLIVVVADARLDNRPELLSSLHLEGQARERRVTDAELIARAYRRWGLAAVGRLLGAFAFALWDPAERRLLCARDQVGARPFYYRRTPRSFAFASEVKQLLALDVSFPAFNEALIGQHLAGASWPHNTTFFAGIDQLAPAHLLVVTPDGERQERYWDVDPARRIRYKNDDAYAEHFRDLFVEAVRCRLRPEESTGVLLSGGLDSSSVASVAAWLHQQGEEVPWPLHTFSFLYDELITADEREFSAAVNAAYGLTPHGLLSDGAWPLRDESEALTDLDEPFVGYYKSQAREGLGVACDAGVVVLLSGHPGDNLVGGNVFDYPDLLWRGQWLHLARELWQHSRQSSLNVAQLFWGACVRRAAPPWLGRWVRSLPVRKREPIPAWIEPSFAARIGLEHLRRQPIFPPPGLSSSGRTRYRNVSHPRPLRPVIEYDRLAGRLGMVFRHPWLDVRLIEFVMAVPTDQTVRAGLRKLVLRNAMQGILPEKVCTRPGKAYPTALAHRGLRERARARVEDLLTDTRMAQCGWVIEGPLRECYARYLAGESNLIWSLWPAITLELWLREHF